MVVEVCFHDQISTKESFAQVQMDLHLLDYNSVYNNKKYNCSKQLTDRSSRIPDGCKQNCRMSIQQAIQKATLDMELPIKTADKRLSQIAKNY